MISPSCCPLRPHELERPDPPRRSRPSHSYTTSRDTTPENYRYTRTRALATTLNIGQPTAHQRVLRIRNRLFAWFVEDYPLPQDALIENAWWNGYRINPAVRLLSLSEMAGADQSSRSSG